MQIGASGPGRGLAGAGGIGSGPQTDGARRIGDVANDGPSFADTLKEALGEVSDLQENARDVIGAFVRGEPVEIQDVMTATQEAGIALEMLIEIRNKLTEAYRSVIQMQA